MVVEEISPFYVKSFECLEKRYVNVTNDYYCHALISDVITNHSSLFPVSMVMIPRRLH